MNPRFYFATCQVGAEKALKSEILTEFPHLKFAFSRPGFITFKEEDGTKYAIAETKSVFARLWGKSVGQAKDPAALKTLIETIPQGAIVHAFERDVSVPGEERESFIPNARIAEVVKSLKKSGGSSFRWDAPAKVNELVYDLIWLDDYHVFLGNHIHRPKLDPAPGNQPALSLPEHSPSRAYLKIVEAIHRFQPKIEKGMQVLEVGCSPGGATTAMLSLGLKVVGVDPKVMDKEVSANPGFKFIHKLAGNVSQDDLVNVNPDWIVMDMNIAPLEALDELSHVIQCLRKNWGGRLKVKQGFLTIKLNDWKFAESIPLYLKRIEECGFREITATQLCSNKQEFFVMARGFKS